MAVSLVKGIDLDEMQVLTIVSNALSTLRQGVPLPTDEIYDPLYDPMGKDHFSMSQHRGPNTYLLSDKHNYDDYIIYMDQMTDPNFDIVAWLVDNKLRNYDDLICTKSSFKPTWHRVAPSLNPNDLLSDTAQNIVESESEVPGLIEAKTSSEEDKEGLDESVTIPPVPDAPNEELASTEHDKPILCYANNMSSHVSGSQTKRKDAPDI